MEIEVSKASNEARLLHQRISEKTKLIHPFVLMGNVEFLVIVSPDAKDGVDDGGNIYIDIDGYEFTISYGFTHTHLAYSKETLEDDVKVVVDFVMDIIEHRIAGYYYISSDDNKRMGFFPFVNDEDIYATFLMEDLKSIYRSKNGGDAKPTVDELIELSSSIENKETATLYYVLFGNDLVKHKFYIEEEEE